MDAAEDDKADVKLTRNNIKAFILDIFTAGSDTTATSVEWMLAHLLNNPGCLHKLRAELDDVVGTSRLVSEHDVARLPYLQAVFKETLRLQPPAVFARAQRETIEPLHVRGYTIPTKTSAVPAFLAALVQCFDWALPMPPPGQSNKPPPLDMEEAEGLVSARKHPLLLFPTQRIHIPLLTPNNPS
ncbi:hypothetical protein PR202_gb18182 [Eleusine coracana subsp. coracana]|uniref:Uncharacterized protein n=1 Tax=Eleusine coracana subsp. coracana TaxID=191504 RepID=A0AAV5F2N8_ELECO|nr:hypothetical protein PR202_gb18182 [Eleusine coracana subsp. coracana]